MSITKENKQELIKEYAINESDTGSAHVQCAVLTSRIKTLTEHMKNNHKDYSSRRGLLILVARRRKFLKYLKNRNFESYQGLIKKLGLKK
ncbi:MAG TPA: 30S ribosomal protein S15 [Candidatus Megaira endosymbiont of Hartmannula sinica]|nr:30S ribosomal protein S15 [Candidatus Megaera endosymbiont of Hartmannula sinica]